MITLRLSWAWNTYRFPKTSIKKHEDNLAWLSKSTSLTLFWLVTSLYLPLIHRWALWFFKNDKSKTWQNNLRLVTKFDTVEDFWALYSHIQLASKLTSGCDYSLFKDGIEPMWEDNWNKHGGRWLITLAKQQRRTELDRFWLETLLCLIGEMFCDYSDDVCGAVINIRAKGDKIAIWTREAENRDGVIHIGRVYKEHLGLSSKVVIGYQAHADTATKSGSLMKNRFIV
ncbi:PREDICTED: eukaryotic translation initiation factor 4E type 1B isoform X1 [Thamnophis sirtalis]|uniref:Eukaryotic translation initiation factor 4E type 1B isoform X1 n=2 Tax=Colubroidea TaxID=34989 RepID=A0A6I9WZ38_9SAUR|nr:PREDICTED: eukaryotic translation initiation factor 4E type 1B isoform X1 [Thamnophis sirtalis]